MTYQEYIEQYQEWGWIDERIRICIENTVNIYADPNFVVYFWMPI